MDIILLAGGTGSRTKLEYPKQLLKLGGKPLIIHSIEIFKDISDIDKIIIAVIPEYKKYFEDLISNFGYDNFICVNAGDTRQQSVYNALNFCKSKRVIIHEAVRPFVTKDLILKLISTKGEAVVPFTGVTSTVFYNESYIDRNDVKCIQLPQVFDTQALKTAHESAKGKNYTDDSSLFFYESGTAPVFIEGTNENIKITTPIDIKLAEVIYNEACIDNRG